MREIRRFLLALVAAALFAAGAEARDVYKGSLDPAIPLHKAILDTLEELKENPNDAGLHNDLGALIARGGYWRDALREFDTAAKLDTKTGKPYYNAGLVHAAKQQWGAAKRAFHAARRRDPGNWPAWWMEGFAEEQLGDEPAAVESYKTSLRLGTGLFDVSKNPYAAQSRLRARVLLETYEKRYVQTTLKDREQLAEPERVAWYFQTSPRAAAASPPVPAPPVTPQDEPLATGPVVTTVQPGGPGGGGPATGAGPTRTQPGMRQIPPRGFPSRPSSQPDTRRIAPPPPQPVEQAAPPEEEPPPQPVPTQGPQ